MAKRKKNRRSPKRSDESWRKRLQEAAEAASEILARCAFVGLDLTVSEVSCGKTRFPHWQFRRDGIVLLHYWPTSGRTLRPNGTVRGKVDTPEEAFALAIDQANEVEV